MDDARTARAEAKAAKARAKALRPWYRKKRWILSMAFVAIVAISAVGGAASNSSNNAAAGNTSAAGAAAPSATSASNAPMSHFTNKTHPAADDVEVAGCELDSDLGLGTAHLSVTNHSSKESNYMVTVEFADPHGTQVGTANGFAENVSAGQHAVPDAGGSFTGPSAGVTCRIKSVDRFAS